VAGIEVFTLFPEKEFTSELSRNTGLVDEINRRIRPVHWYVSIDIIDWKRQPRVTHIAKWLEKKVASLPTPAEIWLARSTRLLSTRARTWSLHSSSFLAVR
jgi:hypothetical protein